MTVIIFCLIVHVIAGFLLVFLGYLFFSCPNAFLSHYGVNAITLRYSVSDRPCDLTVLRITPVMVCKLISCVWQKKHTSVMLRICLGKKTRWIL